MPVADYAYFFLPSLSTFLLAFPYVAPECAFDVTVFEYLEVVDSSDIAFLPFTAGPPFEAPLEPRAPLRVDVGDPSASEASPSCVWASASLPSPDPVVEAFLDFRLCCRFLMPNYNTKVSAQVMKR